MLKKIKNKFNFDYFSMWREIPLLLFAELFVGKKDKITNNKILLVCPCLIGEFVMAIPAIHDYAKRNKNKRIDLLVTPQLKDLAKKIAGINDVFVTKSAYVGRNAKEFGSQKQEFSSYEKILVLRISEMAYATIFKIKKTVLRTSFLKMFKYTMHLAENMIKGKHPKSWRSLNFDILNGKESEIFFEETFNFTDDDKNKINSLNIFDDRKKIIIIHVGTKWVMKRWERERWVELLKKINNVGNFRFVFVGSDDDVEDYQYISSRLDFKVESLIKKVSLSELLLIMKKAQCFIGIDSGPSNMAHLVGLRSLTIYGPGPHMYLPTDPRDVIFDKTNRRGLFQLIFEVKNSYIKKVSVDEVYNAFLNLYNNSII